jgi:hypothetical protein
MNKEIIKDSIFVQIAACEERFIELTIKSAISNAKNPDNLYFGVFNNIINKEHSLLNNDFITKNPKIFYTEIITPVPMGVGFGRMNASLLHFDFFDYSFQIDAHMLFTKNWDEQLINSFNKIKDENNIDEHKLVLSATSSLYWSLIKDELSENSSIKLAVIDELTASPIIIDDPLNLEKIFDSKIKWGNSKNKFVYDGKQNNVEIKDSVGFPVVYGGNQVLSYGSDYIETNGVHATFMFSKSSLSRHILHDPEDMFHGDQTNYSIRLLSRGYRIFSPAYPVLASLNKFLIVDGKIVTVDEEYNWRKYKSKKINNYSEYKSWLSFVLWNRLISGDYHGYWGTPNKQTLEKVKKDIGYES